jgi:inner membrane protein
MATVLTHAIVGTALALNGPSEVPRKRLVFALVALSVLPDLDVLAFKFGIPYEHVFGHRGFSHSLAFAAFISWIVARFGFSALSCYSRAWWRLFFTLAVGTASHGFLDALTNGGLGVGFLLPFNTHRFFFPIQPLEVPPIGVASILHERMLSVIFSEIVYIWIPLLSGFAIASVVRRLGGFK